MNNHQDNVNNRSKVLYSDALVEINEESILFYNYYFPTGDKRVRFDQIENLTMLEPNIWNGKWRLLGTGDFRTWFPADYGRPSRDKIFIIRLKNKWRRIGFTVENSITAAKIFIDKELLIEQDLERKYSMQNTTNSGDKTWGNIKEGYLYQVEKSLMKVKHPAKKQVLEDVSAHLDMKYAELGEEKRDWENYQGIITDMGPAEDYAELLATDIQTTPRRGRRKFLVTVGVIASFIFILLLSLPFVFKTIKEADFEIDQMKSSDRIEDNIDFPFADDPEVIGVWESVDFVENIGDFAPDQKRWGGELFLNELKFYENGRILHVNDNAKDGFWLKWTRGIVMCSDDKTAEKYHIQEIGGEKYMFYEWKSGDYTVRHRKPSYYVLKKAPVGNTIIADQGTEEGVGSAYAWLELIDNGRYGRSWEEAASIFKAHVSQAQWEKALEAIYTPLGKVIDREVISQTPTKSVPGAPDGDYVIIQFRTEFENKKGAIETVTPMLDKDGQWRVSGYFIK